MAYSKNWSVLCTSIKPALILCPRPLSGYSPVHNAAIGRAMMNLGYGNRQWPEREDMFAARQIMLQNPPARQNQSQNRHWSTSSSRLDQTTSRRRPSQDLNSHTLAEMDTEVPANKRKHHREAAGRVETTAAASAPEGDVKRNQGQEQGQEQGQDQGQEQSMAAGRYEMQSSPDQRLGTIREVLFGRKDDKEDEDELERRRNSEELWRKVSAQHTEHKPTNTKSKLSRKVICPYPSYISHRTRWAEFRHGMIYGRNTF